MKIHKVGICTQDMLAFGCGACMILVILILMNRDYPFVGHDYEYFIPRLLDSGIHIRLNGWAIQWYTPSFGGGLPAFPNPQHMQYTIVQLLTLWLNPWSAVLVSTAGISMVGYYCFYLFLHNRLHIGWKSSTLGALFFLGNGFHIAHLIAGQMGYQLFPLTAVMLYALTDMRGKIIYNAAIIAITITLIIYQAGFYLIIILALSLAITLPLLYLIKHEMLDLNKIIVTVITALLLAGLITASKIFAVLSFMQHFPRSIFNDYQVGLFQAGMGLVAQLLGVMGLEPILIALQQNPDWLSGALSKITGSKAGIWETDTGLSPVLNFFLLSGLASGIGRLRNNVKINMNRSMLVAWILLVFAIWITIEMTFAKGFLYTATKQLPIFKSLHINVRFAAAFIMPLIILGVIQLESFFLKFHKPLFFFTLAAITITSLLSYFSLSADAHTREFNVSLSNVIYKNVQRGSTFPVRHIADITQRIGFTGNASSYRPYEPIFGYHLEDFHSEIKLGSVFAEEAGYLNMTNPSSLVFPQVNHTYPFERIRVTEKIKLEQFVQRRQPKWILPTAQRVLNIVSFSVLILTISIFLKTKLMDQFFNFPCGKSFQRIGETNDL